MLIRLVQSLNLRFYMSQGCLKGGAAARIRGSLRKDIFLLQFEGLQLTGDMRFLYLLPAIVLRTTGKHSRLRTCCHLLLHRFALPTSSHVSIVRARNGIAQSFPVRAGRQSIV